MALTIPDIIDVIYDYTVDTGLRERRMAEIRERERQVAEMREHLVAVPGRRWVRTSKRASRRA